MKGLVKKVIGFVFFYSGIVSLKLWLEKKDYVIILFGHKITTDGIGFFSGVHPGHLDRTLQYLVKRFQFITMNEATGLLTGNQKLENRYLVLTFDDGFRDNYYYGFPIFLKHKVPAIVYLVYDCIEKEYLPWSQRLGYIFQITQVPALNWNFMDFSINKNFSRPADRYGAFVSVKQRLSKMESDERIKAIESLEEICKVEPLRNQMMTWSHVLEMQSQGFDFGAHTMTHPILKNLKEEKAVEEMVLSKTKISERINKEVDHFAFPAGSYSEYLLKRVPDMGYKTCFVRTDGFDFKMYPGADPYKLVRLGIANEPHYVILSEISGVYNFFRKLF